MDRFLEWLRRHREWSQATFGPHLQVSSTLDHIQKEVDEARLYPGDKSEWVDIIILAVDGLQRNGASDEEIMSLIEGKQAVNERRKWPDWRTADLSKAIEHVRTGD